MTRSGERKHARVSYSPIRERRDARHALDGGGRGREGSEVRGTKSDLALAFTSRRRRGSKRRGSNRGSPITGDDAGSETRQATRPTPSGAHARYPRTRRIPRPPLLSFLLLLLLILPPGREHNATGERGDDARNKRGRECLFRRSFLKNRTATVASRSRN